eukprot:1013128-Pleurochrysis_carterae.AAC.1
MSPPYHYPFLDPPSRGDFILESAAGFRSHHSSGSTMIKQSPKNRKVVLGNEVEERVVMISALRNQECYDVGISP